MGAALDAVSRPAGKCTCCPIELNAGDWYYDPECPNLIHCVPEANSMGLLAEFCNTTDFYLNETTGVKYHYDDTLGMSPVGFSDEHPSYLILGEIVGDIVMTSKSTLIFQGGRFTGSLHGCDTTIDAGPVHIFDVDIALTGTFVNEFAYPEWWGAKSEKPEGPDSNSQNSFNPTDNSPFINAAFASPFGVIRFCHGFYYISESIVLTKVKTIIMQGEGLTYYANLNLLPDLCTVIWTDQDIDGFIINITDQEHELTNNLNWHQRLSITGGAIDVSACGRVYNHSAMVLCLTLNSYRNSVISTSLLGRKLHDNESIFEDGIIVGGKGFEIRKLTTPNQKTGSLFTTELTLHISCFGTGFSTETVDDKMFRFNTDGIWEETTGVAVTSLMLHGVIDECTYFIKSPYRCFEGGVIDATLQVKKTRINGTDAIVSGDFKDCYINCKVWDAALVNIFDLQQNDSQSNRNIRFGPNTMEYLSSVYDVIQPKLLAHAASLGNGTMRGEMGYHDLNALGAATIYLGYKDYIHIIDNDLLGIDSALEDVTIEVNEIRFQSTEPFFFQGLHYEGSPFDLGGMKFFDLLDHMSMSINITFPINGAFQSRIFNCVIVHLMGRKYGYFNNLRITATIPTAGSMTVTELFNGSYHQIPTADEQSEVIIPLRQRKSMGNDDPVLPSAFASLTFDFISFVSSNNKIWATEQFGLFIEGRLNRPVSQTVLTSSGGALGGDLTKNGKPYLLGNRNYTSLQNLPVNAAPGAIAVVAERPVIKTLSGWMYQQLSCSSQELIGLSQSGINVGQNAFNTTLLKPVWWNGEDWIDAVGE